MSIKPGKIDEIYNAGREKDKLPSLGHRRLMVWENEGDAVKVSVKDMPVQQGETQRLWYPGNQVQEGVSVVSCVKCSSE